MKLSTDRIPNLLFFITMSRIFCLRTIVVFMAVAGLTTASAEKYYGYEERNHHGSEPQMSSTEKAIASAVIDALAAASSEAAARRGEPAYSGDRYNPPPPDYRGQENVIVVRVTSAQGGVVPVYLKRTSSGYVGPRGEYYPSMPSAETLGNFYGGWNSQQTNRQPAVPHVAVEQGRVRLIRDGRTICSLRPAMPFVEKYKLVNNNEQIIIKSRAKHGPATVELYNISDGSLSDKVLAFAIKKGRPTWAKGWQD
jgi:hypothetical protein